MSGILGFWDFDGKPADEALLLKMSSQLAHRGPDGVTHFVSGSAAFAYLQMRVTPESLNERQPLCSTHGVVVLFDGRLDNRDELLSLAESASGLSRESPDVDFVLRAYESRGEDFATRLDGDFVAAVFDPSARRLVLARDAIGARSLNYCRFGQTLLFASEVKGLRPHPSVHTEPNVESLAEFLFRHWDYSDETNTFFSGISRVPPGRSVILTPDKTTIRRYFDFDARRTLRLRSAADHVEAYRDAFARAVKNRMRSIHPVAISVSGGLDSSSIFCMAAHLRKTGDPVAPFFGVGLVGTDVRGNERPFQEAARDWAGADLVLQSVSDMAVSSDRKQKMWYTEAPLLIQAAWQNLYAASAARGARTYLSGFFGDHLLMNSHYIVDLVLQGKWMQAFRSLGAYYSDRWYAIDEFPASRWQLTTDLIGNVRSYAIPEKLRPLYQWLRRKLRSQLVPRGYYSEWFQRLQSERMARVKSLRLPAARIHSKALYGIANSKAYSNRLEMDLRAIGMFGMEMAYPFYDRNLIALVMSMPGEAVYPSGESRGIHREAMRGILPETIRTRRSKGDFNRLGRLGGLKDLEGLVPLLLHGRAMAHGFLKAEPELRSDLALLKEDLLDETDASAYAYWKTADLLELETFLEVFFDQQ